MVRSVAFRITTLLRFLLSMSHIIWNKKQICFPSCTKICTHIPHVQTDIRLTVGGEGMRQRHQARKAAESGTQCCSLHTTKESIHTRKAGTIVYLHSNALPCDYSSRQTWQTTWSRHYLLYCGMPGKSASWWPVMSLKKKKNNTTKTAFLYSGERMHWHFA